MPRWKWALLLFELVLFALILILPQVALPEFTFHGGTAPVIVKYRLSSPPLDSQMVLRQARIAPAVEAVELPAEEAVHYVADSGQSRLALLCVLIC